MTAERIDCPAPLPEDPVSALLAEMLVPAPYEVPVKKAKKKAVGTRKSLRRNVVPDSCSKDTEAHSYNDNKEGEEENPLPQNEGEKKRKVSPSGEAEGSKRGRTIPPDSFANIDVGEDEWPPRARRPA